jgi:hypothetical protein
MNRKRYLICAVSIILIGLMMVPAAGGKMLKEVAIGVFDNAPSMAETDHFYMRYHGPEIVRLSGPWMANYKLWLPYEPPEEAVAQFGAVRGRYAELWYREDDYLDRPGLSGITNPPFNTKKSGQANVMVPANPTETFYDSDPHPEKTPILRWVTFINYPEGVSEETGEKWFLEVYAREAVKQPGLLKFVSHRVWKNGNTDVSLDEIPAGDLPPMKSWARMCEYWYTDFDAWRKAVLTSPPKYTAPPWGGEYPFVEMTSTFIPYYHDVDFLKGTYQIDFDHPRVTYSTSP